MCQLCRFVILLSDDKDYFFILYVVYVGMNMLLAGIALLHWPGADQLELVNDPEGYQVRMRSMLSALNGCEKPSSCLVAVIWCPGCALSQC